MEIEIVTFVVKGSAKLTVPTDWQEQIQVGSRSVKQKIITPKQAWQFSDLKQAWAFLCLQIWFIYECIDTIIAKKYMASFLCYSTPILHRKYI